MHVRISKNDFATLRCAKQFLERHMAMLISRMNVDMAIALRDPGGGPKMHVRISKNDFATLRCAKQFLERHMAMLISRMNVDLAVALAMGLTPRNEQSCGKHRCVTTAPMTLQKYCTGASSCRGPSFNGLDSVSKLSDPHCLPQAGTESWKHNVSFSKRACGRRQ